MLLPLIKSSSRRMSKSRLVLNPQCPFLVELAESALFFESSLGSTNGFLPMWLFLGKVRFKALRCWCWTQFCWFAEQEAARASKDPNTSDSQVRIVFSSQVSDEQRMHLLYAAILSIHLAWIFRAISCNGFLFTALIPLSNHSWG